MYVHIYACMRNKVLTNRRTRIEEHFPQTVCQLQHHVTIHACTHTYSTYIHYQRNEIIMN